MSDREIPAVILGAGRPLSQLVVMGYFSTRLDARLTQALGSFSSAHHQYKLHIYLISYKKKQ
jgi:hypothetical protein